MEDKQKTSIYNSIQNLYNMDSVTWQQVLAVMYNTVSDIEDKFDIIESKFGVLLPKEVREEIKRLTQNGSLAEIINGEVFEGLNKKIIDTKEELSSQLDEIAYDVKSFGAKGDGVSIDTLFIKNALVKLAQTGGTLKFPKGTYIVDDEFVISSYKKIVISGENGTVIKMKDNTNKTMFWGELNEDITFKDITLDGNRANNIVGVWPHEIHGAIICAKGKRVTIDNCIIKNFNYGVCPSGQYGGEAKIINCYFENNNDDIDTYCINLLIEGNVSNGCTQNSIQVESLGVANDNIADYRNEIDLSTLAVNTVISNNSVINCNGIGINIFSGVSNLVVNNNTLTNIGKIGINADKIGSKNIVIADNVITNVTYVKSVEDGLPQNRDGSGIYIANGVGVLVCNNIISYCRTGINSYKGIRQSILNNLISYCKTSGICLHTDVSSKCDGNYMNNNALSNIFWANGGIYLNSCNDCTLSDNYTKETSLNTNKQRSCVYIHTGNINIKCSDNVGVGTLEGGINKNALSQLDSTNIPTSTKCLFYGIDNAIEYQVNGKKVVGSRQSAIADCTNGQEVNKINSILIALRNHGLIES